MVFIVSSWTSFGQVLDLYEKLVNLFFMLGHETVRDVEGVAGWPERR